MTDDWKNMPPTPSGTRVAAADSSRVIVYLPVSQSWHGEDGERRYLTLTPQAAKDLMNALEWWKDER
jgi:hypothetical protein